MSPRSAPIRIDPEASVTWDDKATPPTTPGVYRVKYVDHSGTVEHLDGRPCLAYWDGVDTWSERWFVSVAEAYQAKMRPGRMYEWTGASL
jgi:hypothetical protein